MYYVKEILKLLESDYFLTYNGGIYASVDEVEKASLSSESVIVKGIACVDGKLQVSLIDNPVIKNDLNAEWVKEYRK